MYKIIINEQCLILCLSNQLDKINIDSSESLVVLYRGRKRQFYPFIDSMEKHIEDRTIIMHSDDLKGMYKMFKSIFKVIKAAGGIARNKENQILFIFRRGHWDLPKGKIDIGEKKKEAAVREVMEETGVSDLRLIDKIGNSYHVYRDKKNRRCLKLTYWYRMECNDTILTPQREEGIELVQWETTSTVKNFDQPIYFSILEVLKKEEKMEIKVDNPYQLSLK